MAKMPWRLLLLLLAATGRCKATIAPNDLETLVTPILNKLNSQIGEMLPMFSLAVNIPRVPGFDTYDPNQVDLDGAKKAMLDCKVFSSRDVVAATLLKWDNVLKYCPDALVPWDDVLEKCKEKEMTWRDVQKNCPEEVEGHAADHAEYRVLERFQSWAKAKDKDKSGLLLFYVYASPCTNQCTVKNHARSILSLAKAITGWKKHAVVFSKIFTPRNSQSNAFTVEKSKSALKRLGNSLGQGGLQNVFRCDSIKNKGKRVCQSCSSGNDVTPWCYDDNVQPSDCQTLPGRNQRNRGKRSLGKRRGENLACAFAPRVPPWVKATPTSQNGHFGQGEEATSDWEDMVPGPPAWGSVRERGPSERRKGREGQKQEGQRASVEGKKKRSQGAKAPGRGPRGKAGTPRRQPGASRPRGSAPPKGGRMNAAQSRRGRGGAPRGRWSQPRRWGGRVGGRGRAGGRGSRRRGRGRG